MSDRSVVQSGPDLEESTGSTAAVLHTCPTPPPGAASGSYQRPHPSFRAPDDSCDSRHSGGRKLRGSSSPSSRLPQDAVSLAESQSDYAVTQPGDPDYHDVAGMHISDVVEGVLNSPGAGTTVILDPAEEEKLMSASAARLAASSYVHRLVEHEASKLQARSIDRGAVSYKATSPALDASPGGETTVNSSCATAAARISGRLPGQDEAVVRDVADAVVREISGIFESLLDKVLLQKKQDTIRTMVNEIVKEDIPDVLQRMVEHQVAEELSVLRQDVKLMDERWEEKFLVTKDLQESEDDLWLVFDERHQELQERVSALETGCVSNEHFGEVKGSIEMRFEEWRQHALEEKVHRAELSNHLETTDTRLQEALNIRHELYLIHDMLRDDLDSIGRKLQEGLDGLYAHAASKADVDRQHSDVGVRLESLERGVASVEEASQINRETMEAMRLSNEELFATKKAMDQGMQQHTEVFANRAQRMETSLQELQESKASTDELHRSHGDLSGTIAKLQMDGNGHAAAIDMLVSDAQAFRAECKTAYVSQDTAAAFVKDLAMETYHEIDMREEIAKLKVELDTERSKGAQLSRQQEDRGLLLSDAIEAIAELRVQSKQLLESREELTSHLHTLDQREEGHWDEGQQRLGSLEQSCGDMRVLLASTKDDLLQAMDRQKTDADYIRHHGTQRLFEQMDKALTLHQSVRKVELGHKEINDTLKSLKLPRVPERGASAQ